MLKHTIPPMAFVLACALSLSSCPADGPSLFQRAYNYTSATAIPDQGTVNIPITIDDVGELVSIDSITIELTHTFAADLTITLVSPDMTMCTIRNGEGDDNNYDGTYVFVQGGADYAIAAGAITPGTYGLSLGSDLAASFGASNLSGTWYLRVKDSGTGDIGSVQAWSLKLSFNG